MIEYEQLESKWEEFRKKEKQLNEAFNSSEVIEWKYLPKDLVIDENKSVKWNREEIERRREAYQTARKNKDNEIANALKEVNDAIKEYIQQNYNITDKKYYKMLYFLYEHDEDTYNYTNGFGSRVEYLEDLADLVGGNE